MRTKSTLPLVVGAVLLVVVVAGVVGVIIATAPPRPAAPVVVVEPSPATPAPQQAPTPSPVVRVPEKPATPPSVKPTTVPDAGKSAAERALEAEIEEVNASKYLTLARITGIPADRIRAEDEASASLTYPASSHTVRIEYDALEDRSRMRHQIAPHVYLSSVWSGNTTERREARGRDVYFLIADENHHAQEVPILADGVRYRAYASSPGGSASLLNSDALRIAAAKTVVVRVAGRDITLTSADLAALRDMLAQLKAPPAKPH